MSEFDEWFEDYEDKFEINAEILCKDAFQAGQQSQQAKIDELQKRINGAIQALEQSKPNMMRQYDAMQALYILKGNKDESY